jgi:hypothetical protein
MKYVGAKKVGCDKCIYCRTFLVQKEILYATDSVISQKQAKTEGLRCSSCNCILHLQKENSAVSHNNKAYSEEKSQKQPK